MSDHVNEVNDHNFGHVVLQSEMPVLVDFWAQWCGPCRTLAPIVETVAKQYAGRAHLVKLNVDYSPASAQRYGVLGIPTLILFRGGEEKERIIGAASAEEISRAIGRYVTDASN